MIGERAYQFGFFAILILIVALRFTNLDSDPPAYNLSGINVTDEPYYTLYGLNDYLEEKNRLIVDLQFKDTYFLFQHNYLITKYSLEIFGNNYLGLRFGVVLISLLAMLMLFQITIRTFELNNLQKLLFLALIGFEFSFFVFSRYQTPQLYSVVWLIAALAGFTLIKGQFLRYFVTTMIVLIGIVWVYPYLVFVAIGYFFWVIYISVKDKTIRPLGYSTLGVTAALLFLTVSFALIGQDFESIVSFYSSVSEVRDESVISYNLAAIVTSLLQIPFTNFIRLQPIIGLFGLLGLAVGVYRFRYISKIEQLVLLILISAFLQSIFIHSYPFKKWVIIFPCLFVLMFTMICQLRLLSRTEQWLTAGVSLILAALLAKGIMVGNSLLYWEAFSESYPIIQISTILQGSLFAWLFVSIMLITFCNQNGYLLESVIMAAILCTLPFTSSYLTNPKYEYRDALTSYSRTIHNNIIIGEFSHAFSFYNQGQVAQNPYSFLFQYIDSAQVEQRVAYQDSIIFIKKDLNGSNHDSSLNMFNQSFQLKEDSIFDLYINN